MVQESDWLLRGPHQQHHLMEKMSLKGHLIHVIDYPITWRNEKDRSLLSKRTLYEDVSRFYPGSKITVIRPAIVKLPLLDKMSIPFSHREEIKKQIKDFKPDVIIGLGILNNYYAIREAKKAGIPFIYYLIDSLHRLINNSLFRYIAKKIEKNNIKNAILIITINKKLMEYAVNMGGYKEHISVIPAGIDFNFFNSTITGDEVRLKYNILEKDLVLFYMGWLYNFSGIKEVAKEVLRLGNKNIRLLIVGEGEAMRDLENIKRYDINNLIILTGKQPYNLIPKFIASSDVCILPAYNNDIMKDIVPIKLYEYMAMGKPVITTHLTGVITEFGEENGLFYIEKPEHTVFKALEIKNKGLINFYGSKSKKTVVNNNWDKITKDFELCLKQIISK